MARLFSKRRRATDPRRDGSPDAPAHAAQPLPRSGVFALMGATGGVGTTTAACALAVELATRLVAQRPGLAALSPEAREPRVCLLDLDFEAGACAHHLDLLPTLQHEDMARPCREMDTTLVSSMIDQSVGGVSLISAANGGTAPVNPRTVLALLDAAMQLFDFVVLDVPRRIEPWTLAALAGADSAAVLCELTVPSLHMARLRRMQMAPALQGTGRALHPVIAKLERRGGRGSLSPGDLQTALGEPAFATLPMDPDPLRAVINSGEPLALEQAECRYMRDLRVLADRLLRDAADRAPAQPALAA